MQYGPMSRLLLAAAGANDPIILDGKVPSDAIHREITVGMGMLSTTAFAFVAALTSLLMVFEGQPWRWGVAVPLAMLWAVAIFTIDRALVLSMNRARWAAISARLLLGTLVAVLISMPIDITLFQDRVKSVLLQNRQDEQIQARERISRIHGLAEVDRTAEQAQADLASARRDVNTLPEQVLSLKSDTRACDTQLDRKRQKVVPEIAEIGSQLSANISHKQALSQTDPDNAETLQALDDERRRLLGQRNALNIELALAGKHCDRLRGEATTAEKNFRERARLRVADASERATTARADAASAARLAQHDAEKARVVIETSLAESFVAKAEALHHLVWTKPSAAVTYFLILSLWITMEMAAIMAKIMAGPGCIDQLLRAKGEHIVFEATIELTRRQEALRTEMELEEVMREKAIELAREDPAYAQDKLRQELQARTVLAAHRELQRELRAYLDESDRLRERAGQGSTSRDGAVSHALNLLDREAAQAVIRAFEDHTNSAVNPVPQA